jgi:hypothetical protein
MPTVFTASYDGTTKVLSVVVCLGLCAAVLLVHNLFVTFTSVAVIVLGYAYSPRSYSISGREIIVKRLIGSVRVPLDRLKEARLVTPDDLRGGIRLWGSGGMFGYYGLFRTTKLGNCRWYVTNRRNMVVVVTESKTTLYSPDDTEGFLAAVEG